MSVQLVFLHCDRYVVFHSQHGHYYKTRIPKFGRDFSYHYPSCDLYFVGTRWEYDWMIGVEAVHHSGMFLDLFCACLMNMLGGWHGNCFCFQFGGVQTESGTRALPQLTPDWRCVSIIKGLSVSADICNDPIIVVVISIQPGENICSQIMFMMPFFPWLLNQGEQCVWHQPHPSFVCHRNLWGKCHSRLCMRWGTNYYKKQVKQWLRLSVCC